MWVRFATHNHCQFWLQRVDPFATIVMWIWFVINIDCIELYWIVLNCVESNRIELARITSGVWTHLACHIFNSLWLTRCLLSIGNWRQQPLGNRCSISSISPFAPTLHQNAANHFLCLLWVLMWLHLASNIGVDWRILNYIWWVHLLHYYRVYKWRK